MKILNRVGGAFLLLVLGFAVIQGFQSELGRPIWDDLWAAGSAVLSYVRDLISGLSRTGIDGDVWKAIAIAGLFVIGALGLAKKPVTVRTFTILLLLAAFGAFVLYDPTVVATT